MVQLFVVDRVDIGLLNVADAKGRRRQDETISQLSDSIQHGLTGNVGSFRFGVTSLRQCEYLDGLNNGCKNGTVIATSSSPTTSASFSGKLGAVVYIVCWLLATMVFLRSSASCILP